MFNNTLSHDSDAYICSYLTGESLRSIWEEKMGSCGFDMHEYKLSCGLCSSTNETYMLVSSPLFLLVSLPEFSRHTF